MTTPELSEAVGVSTRKVLSWIERGYLVNPGDGHGTKRTWTAEDLQKARLLPGLELVLRPEAILAVLH